MKQTVRLHQAALSATGQLSDRKRGSENEWEHTQVRDTQHFYSQDFLRVKLEKEYLFSLVVVVAACYFIYLVFIYFLTNKQKKTELRQGSALWILPTGHKKGFYLESQLRFKCEQKWPGTGTYDQVQRLAFKPSGSFYFIYETFGFFSCKKLSGSFLGLFQKDFYVRIFFTKE